MRHPGPITASDDVRDALVSLLAVGSWQETQRLQVPMAPYTLSVEDIEAVESALGGTLPEDLLAVFAAGVPDDASLADVHELTQTVRKRGASRTAIAIAKLDGHSFLCWEPGDNGDNPRLSRYNDDDQSTERFRLTRWLQSRLDAAADDLDVDPEDAVSPVNLARFTPMLVSAVASDVARVQHVKFGEGSILRTVEGDKVEVQFDGEDKPRVLLRRFLKF